MIRMMNWKKVRFPLIIGLILLAWLALSSLTETGSTEIRSDLQAGEVNLEGFKRATAPIEFAFPLDHGPHPDYLTEWWYFTGNLDSPEGDHFGYQLTFFRRALAPAGTRQPRTSAWAADQIYFAHFTVTDVSREEHQAFERLARSAAPLANRSKAWCSLPLTFVMVKWAK